MAASFVALQVADLFDAHAAEAPIHRLVSVLNAQAAQIRELQENLRLVQASQRQTLADCKILRAAVSMLEHRVQKAESEGATMKKSAIAMRAQLETIDCQLRVKADRQEVDDVEIRAKTASGELGKELRCELASLQLVQCLQTEQTELHERMEAVDRRLITKMDKSESARLDGVLVQIHSFRPMVTQLSKQVETVQLQQKQTQRFVARLDSEHEAHKIGQEEAWHHADKLRQMLDAFEHRHHQAVAPQIQRLDSMTDQLQLALDELKTAAATSEATLRALSAKFHSSGGAFATQLQQQYQHFEQNLQEKAPRQEIEAQLADLSRQIAAKAPDSAHRALSSSLEDLRTRCEKLQEHVELSTRFLDWFASRGEAYEHNLELVETQLGRLALDSRPHERDPFEGRVRFPRSP
ncbi:hypothetical protein KRP22_006542 [Phytophthora ramorum]|uniref:uncharacterized protein n=1 Tax=Phytophthora ramorum TaxID=164328 RepID=UPI0030AAF8DC|nr:hypothetical protein KRP23_4444 [Phytophthora ramorum]KAH7507226.1 hypothetical protein KRP22_2329 [Phytophthora ramorum]